MRVASINSEFDYLNLGCGYRFNSKWTNVDFVSTAKDVIAHDLTKGIPFADNSFALVYHSHLLEHFPKTGSEFFIRECYRVLKPGGVLRIVVPDLEQIARIYLEAVEKADRSEEWAANYEWMSLELLDQMVRNRKGGDMVAYFEREIANQDFVTQRFGSEAKKIWQAKQNYHPKHKHLSKRIKESIAAVEKLLPKSLLKLYRAIQIGYYRQSGEVHQWMYDRYSLSVLVKNCGFTDVVRRTASESYIPSWDSFNLDTEPDGKIYKPDSLFIEAIKPD